MALNSLFCADVPLSNYSLNRRNSYRLGRTVDEDVSNSHRKTFYGLLRTSNMPEAMPRKNLLSAGRHEKCARSEACNIKSCCSLCLLICNM